MKFRARGARRVSGQMNKTEGRYANELATQHRLGHIHWYAFEGMKFKLADKTFYTPDFIVLTNDGFLEAHEVKGFWEDDARVKIKVAAQMFPVKFIAVKPVKGGGWETETF